MGRVKKGKIVGVCGSPRKGNSQYLLEAALDAAKKAGAETELVLLRQLGEIKKNDVEEFDNLVDATGIILACPSYDHDVTDLMKDFFASLKPLAGSGLLANKKGGVIAIGSESLKSIKSAASVMEDFLAEAEINHEKTITIIADKPDDARRQKSAVGAAMVLGKRMVGE
jgi:multimeric flavodoxin WrbA